MTTTRNMFGVADFSGQRVHTLRIGAMVARRPEPRYEAMCEVCGTRATETQTRIRNGSARCLSSGCGKGRLREILNDNPRKAAEREAQNKRAIISVAEAKLKETHRQLTAVLRERLLGKVKDPDRIAVDPAVNGVRMSLEQAADFNGREFRKFREAHPEVFWTPDLLMQVDGYLEANGLPIVTAVMLTALIERYRDAGLLPDPPQAEPQPEPAPEPEPEQPTGPRVFVGRDWQTGLEKTFTEREVSLMSSDAYRRAFRTLPTFSALLGAMAEQTEQL